MSALSDSYFPPPLSWDAFEAMSLDVFTQRFHNPQLKRYGRNGQEQNGVDILGPYPSGGFIGIQCKNHPSGTITMREIREEIAKAERFSPALSHYVIATSSPRDASITSAVAQVSEDRRASGHFTVEIYFWEDICHELARDPRLIRYHYPELSVHAPEPLQPKIDVTFENRETEITLAADWEYQPPRENKKAERIPPRHPGGRGVFAIYPVSMWYTPGKTPGTTLLQFRVENTTVTEAIGVALKLELPEGCHFISTGNGETFYPSEKQKAMKRNGRILSVRLGNLLHNPAYETDAIYAVFTEPATTYPIRWSVTAGNLLGETQGVLLVHLQGKEAAPSRRFPERASENGTNQ